MLLIVLCTVGFSILLNSHTGNVIRRKREEASTGILAELLPGGKSFEDITATLTIAEGSGVSLVYKEKDGTVAGVTANTNGDYKVEEGTFNSYIGKDSTLPDIIHISKATESSKAVKKAVEAAFSVLSANGLMKAAAKEMEQVFEELLPSLLFWFLFSKYIKYFKTTCFVILLALLFWLQTVKDFSPLIT